MDKDNHGSYILSISVLFIKEEIHCDEFAAIETNMNDVEDDSTEDSFNAKNYAKSNECNRDEDEIFIKEEPLEYDSVSAVAPLTGLPITKKF